MSSAAVRSILFGGEWLAIDGTRLQAVNRQERNFTREKLQATADRSSRTRRNTVEPPFGTSKHALNQGHFLLKGLRQVRAEFSLSTHAYNLLRVINIVGVKALVEARRRRWRALARAARRAHGSRGLVLRSRVASEHSPRTKLHPRLACSPERTAKPAFSHNLRGLLRQ